MESLPQETRSKGFGLFIQRKQVGGAINFFYRCVKGVNISEGEEVFKLRENEGTKTYEYKLTLITSD